MRKLSLLLLAHVFSASYAFAGTALGTIELVELGPAYGHKVFIKVKGDVSGQPSCHTDGTFHFAFDSSEPGGDSTLSVVLSAKAAKQKVRISGYTQCTRYSGVEDLRWIRIEE